MLTRRNFSACAICSIAGFAATAIGEAHAQAPAGIKRTVLSKTEYPEGKYVTILATVEIDAGTTVPRHTHPGVETAYVVDGAIDLSVHGQPVRQVKAGEGFQVPAEMPHGGHNSGDKPVKLAVTYVVEKDKPLVSPAPE
jgi:quercetin dioxygenase-like cupin family protein